MGTLADELARGPMPAGRALEIAAGVAAALSARAAPHLQLAPGAVLLGPGGRVELREPEAVAADTAYLAPEQWGLVPAAPGARSDVYAVAALLHHMLSGRPPGDLRRGERQGSLSGVAASPALAGLLTRALADQPQERPADAGELHALLVAAGAPAGAEELTLPPQRLRSALPRQAVLLGGGLLLLGAGVAVVLGLGGGPGGLLSWMRPGEDEAAEAPGVPVRAGDTGRSGQADSLPDTGRAAGPEGATGTGRAEGPEGANATGRAEGPEGATGTGRAETPEGVNATGRAEGPEGATGTGRAEGPEGATGTGRAQGPEGATATGRAEGPEGATGTGRAEGPEGANPTGRTEGPAEPTETGRAEGPEGANATGRAEGPEEPTETGRAEDPEGATGTGRAEAPEGSTDTGRSADALPYPTGRREGLPPDQVLRVRPDGSEVLLRRVPAGPVRQPEGPRIHEPAFWIEAAPATLADYARFLRAAREAGEPLAALLPAGEAGALLRAHLEDGAQVPAQALPALPPGAGDVFLRWSGLVPLTPRQRLRAEQWGQVPAGDLRGGLPETREGR